MIDKELDNDLDRKLHGRFLDAYKEHLAKVTHWPPMDLYELFYRLGRVDAQAENLASLPSTPARLRKRNAVLPTGS